MTASRHSVGRRKRALTTTGRLHFREGAAPPCRAPNHDRIERESGSPADEGNNFLFPGFSDLLKMIL